MEQPRWFALIQIYIGMIRLGLAIVLMVAGVGASLYFLITGNFIVAFICIFVTYFFRGFPAGDIMRNMNALNRRK